MTGTINLRQARKLKEREKKRAQATENAVSHGQTKAARDLAQAEAHKARAHLDSHRRED